VSEQEDRLLKDINRRNWLLLAILTLISLLWQSFDVSLGVFGGGLIAIIAHCWRYSALVAILSSDPSYAARRFHRGYLFRLGTLAVSLYTLIVFLKVNPIALIIGLSVVVINIFYTTLKRSF